MPAPDRLTVLRTILDDGAVPTFTAADAATAFDMVAGCAAGGSRVVEFTNRGDDAYATFVELARRVRAELPEVILGAGTIIDAPTAALFIAAGARFVVGQSLQRGGRPALQPAARRLHPRLRDRDRDRGRRGARLRDRQALPGRGLRRPGVRPQLPGAEPGVEGDADERPRDRGGDARLDRGRAPRPSASAATSTRRSLIARGTGPRSPTRTRRFLGWVRDAPGGAGRVVHRPAAGRAARRHGVEPRRETERTMTDFDFDRFLELPRLSGLRLSPDGRRLVVAVGGPDPEGKKMRSALWQVDPAGVAPPRRLTRSAAGEAGGAAFLPDGSLLFTSSRPDPDAKPDPERKVQRPVAAPAGRRRGAPARGAGGRRGRRRGRPGRSGRRVRRRHVRRARPTSPPTPSAARRARTPASAPSSSRTTTRSATGITGWRPAGAASSPRRSPATRRRRCRRRATSQPDVETLTFEETGMDLAPDGSFLVAARHDASALPDIREDLVAYDLATGAARVLTPGDAWYDAPAVSPDGRSVAAIRTTFGSPDEASRVSLVLVDLATGEQRTLAGDLDRWPESPVWAPDGSAVFFTADDDGHHPAFRVDLADGRVTRLTAAGALGDLCPTPDGDALFALCSTIGSPPRIVRLDARMADQVPGRAGQRDRRARDRPARRRRAADRPAADGTAIGSWLVRPADASAEHPAPLVVWVHGGPLGSWSSWHWRWSPHVLAARGYAVLMPDPALSTGYGQAMIDRGWNDWGGTPYEDVTAAVDAALAERADLDAGADRADGRLVRRLHGELGRRPHGPLPGHRHPRQPLGAARLPRHDRHRRLLGARDGRPVPRTRAVHPPVALRAPRADPDADARHPRRAGLPRPGERGAPALDGPAPPRRPGASSSTSPTRTTGS